MTQDQKIAAIILAVPVVYTLGFGATQAWVERNIREPNPFTAPIVCGVSSNPTRAIFWPAWWLGHFAYIAAGGSNVDPACQRQHELEINP